MILHIFNDQLKFSYGYFKFLADCKVDFSNMTLLQYGKKRIEFKEFEELEYHSLNSFFSPVSAVRLLRYLFKAEKIIVHSLASPALLAYLALFPQIGKKIYWVIWGKDLYFYHQIEKRRIHHKIYEAFRKKAIKSIKNVVTNIDEEYDLLKKWYKTDAVKMKCNNLYPNAYDYTSLPATENIDKKIVLLGNSGSYTNRHIQVIDYLSKCNKGIDKVICPLSYGGTKKYAHAVSEYGAEIFGHKFNALNSFIDKDKYFEMLNEVNIGVFNYNRQEGVGNIFSLIFKNKTIYLNSNTTVYKYLNRCGIKLYDTKDIKDGKLDILKKEELYNNSEILRAITDKKLAKEQWWEVLFGKQEDK